MIDVSLQQDQFLEVVPTLVQPSLVEALKSRVRTEMKTARPSADLPQVQVLPVAQMLQARLTSFVPESDDAEAENAFYVADLGEVYRQHLRWKALLPRIEPFFGKFFFAFIAFDMKSSWCVVCITNILSIF